ncbi:MAG: AP endonuclease [Spirochaetaceae bacterium]|jgi:hypothetical protein|nr:AP endonuclease [Spirochaetaceae bacterium]
MLAVPSWVIPGTYIENLNFLQDKKEIDAVELLFFIYNDDVKTELQNEWDAITSYKKRFIFTAHLPDPVLSEHEELIVKMLPHVRHFIIHGGKGFDDGADLIAAWQKEYGMEKFVLENTREDRLEKLLEHLPGDTRICMDTGHLLIAKKSPLQFFNKYKNRIAEIHLHGTDNEKAKLDGKLVDHRPVNKNDQWYKEIETLLKNFKGVINMEVFSWEEVLGTLGTLEKI